MRVEAGDRDPLVASCVLVQAAQCFDDCVRRHQVERFPQRFVHRQQRYLEVGRQERHQVVAAVDPEAGLLRQVVGVAAKVGQDVIGDFFFADWCCHQRVTPTNANDRHARVERGHGAFCVFFAALAGHQRSLRTRGVEPGDLFAGSGDFVAGCLRHHRTQSLPGQIGQDPPDRQQRGGFRDQEGGVFRRFRAEQDLGQDLGADPRRVTLGENEDRTLFHLPSSAQQPQLKSSRRSSAESSAIRLLSAERMASASCFLLPCSSRIFSSTVPLAMSR